MITIKGWHDRKDMCIVSKADENISFETAMMMLEASRTGPSVGRIRLPGGRMFEYNRYANGRIIIEQI